MTYTDLYKMFKQPTKENFPESECTIQNEREPEVFDSNKKYLCLIIDTRFEHDYRITLMTPYICKTNDKVEYGWVDCLFKQPHTNIQNTVRLENETVIGFAEFEETDEDKKIWNNWIDSIESQYE